MTELLAFLHIREVPGSNVSLETSCVIQVIYGFPLPLQPHTKILPVLGCDSFLPHHFIH
jgi:hypothetical protein